MNLFVLVARLIGISRMIFGGTLLLWPTMIRILWGDKEGKPTVKISIRALGARDFLLGLGVNLTVSGMHPDAVRWVTFSAVADAVDVLSMWRETNLPRRHRRRLMLASGISAILGFVAAIGLP